MFKSAFLSTILAFSIFPLWAGDKESLTCAISVEYEPFQYAEDGGPRGMDVKIISLFEKASGLKVKVEPMEWNKALSSLYYGKKLDCVWGMEINEKRKRLFSFTGPIYQRHSTLFTKKGATYTSPEDLKGKIIIGDKDSSLENELKSKKDHGIRFRYANTKRESLKMLSQGKAYGAIMPYRVGKALSQKLSLEIVPVLFSKKLNPVAVAVKKEDTDTLRKLEKYLNEVPLKKIKEILGPNPKIK